MPPLFAPGVSSPSITTPFTPSASSPHLGRRPPSPPHYNPNPNPNLGRRPPSPPHCTGSGPSDNPQRSSSVDGLPPNSNVAPGVSGAVELVEVAGQPLSLTLTLICGVELPKVGEQTCLAEVHET